MIKIVNKEKYNEIKENLETYRKESQRLLIEKVGYKKDLEDTLELLKKAKAENEALKAEKKTLKSKITRLENQIKKMQDEEKKSKKLVKETLKEVHNTHKKRAAKKEDNK